MSEWALRLWELQVIRVTFIPANGAPVRPRNVYLDISSDTQPPRYLSQPRYAALSRTLVLDATVPSRPAPPEIVGQTSAPVSICCSIAIHATLFIALLRGRSNAKHATCV